MKFFISISQEKADLPMDSVNANLKKENKIMEVVFYGIL